MIKIIRQLGYQFKEYLLLTVLIIICLFLISISEKPQAKPLKLFALVSFATVDQLIEPLVSIFKKDISYDDLKKENAELMLQLSKTKKALREIEELRSMVNLKDTTGYSLLPVKVISKLVSRFQGNFIINRGITSGLQRGMPVIDDKGLVGLIMDVANDFSTVRTLNNVNLSLAVTVQRSNVDGILSFNGRELVIKDIPSTFDVKEGDHIETSSFSTLFPPSIPVGVIQKKSSNVLGLLHNLTVKSYASIESANNIFVLKVIPNKQIDRLEMNLMKTP